MADVCDARYFIREWGWDFGDLSTVTVHVRRLREKIEEDPATPVLLKTVWGVGYRFDASTDGKRPVPLPLEAEAGRDAGN